MKREHSPLWLLQILLVLLPPGLPAPCPRPCSCPHPAELHCTFRSLLSVPGAVSRHVKRINLGFNSIGHIGVGSLSGLKRLELLMVHGNNIHSLPDGAFRDLASLQMLKMSYNKLKEINRRTLHGLWSLSRLHLDHNQLELIHPDAFQGLTSLRFLQLEGNRLQQLHASTFSTFTLRDQFYISTLRHLHLSDNGLTSLSSQLLGTMPHLESLYLHGNPWTCDCGMSWFHNWEKDSPGVLKCKKDRDLPGGQLCPSCFSPRPLKDTDLHAAAPLVCSSPVISLRHGTSTPPESERQMPTSKDFKDPIGNISMGLSDEHGNKLDLECSIDELQEPSKVSWEQVSKLQLLANVSLSVELQCAVDRKKYEQLWKAIAYYSNVPAHLKRGPALTKDPELAYAYEQDSALDAGYYTGLKVQMWARPVWLMQPSVELQLNRAESSIRMVILALRTTLSELVETEQQQRLGRTWVMIASTNRTRKVMSAILGSPSEMLCNVRSSDPAEIRWTLPDGSELASPYSGPGNRVSVSRDGRLRIKAVTHIDTGAFYCMAKVPGDVAVLSFYLSVQESSSPPPGDDTSAVSMEEFAGNPISMDCPASSSPDAEINWILPSSQIVHSQDNSSKALVHFNGSLYISKTQVSDSGYYKCVAINQHGADTMVKKVSIVRRNGLIRPLRRFPVRPQSASGVSTQVKIPTENAEEASGDVDASTIRHPISGVRRRIPGNLAPGRRGIHPSRSTWQRRTMLRGSHTENQNGSAENRRRIHLSKSKIDPKKWAHILAKARERDAVSPLPASYPTKIEKALTTESLKTPDKSSDGVTVHGNEDQQYLPEQSTETQIKEFPPHGEDDHVTTEPYSERGAANNSRHLTTAPHPTESAYTAQCTTQHTEPNLVTSSDSGFSLPQTTSVPPHGITISQPSARTASSSMVQTAEGRQSEAEPDDVISSINHRFSSESKTNSVKREGSGNYLGETWTLSQFEPKDATESRSAVEPSKPPSTAPKPPGRRKPESNRRLVGSKRRNGGRRKRPNRKKEKLDASNTIKPAAKASISERNTEQPRVTVGSIRAVPSTGSQAASSSRLSHKESSVLRQNHKALTEPFPLPETKDGRLLLPRASWQSSTAAPSLPALTHGNSMLGTAEVFTSALLRSADTLEDSYETSFTTEPAPLLHYGRLTGRYDSLTESQRVHQATGMETSPQPSQFTSTASSTAGGQKAASRETSRGILSTSRRLPKHRNHSSDQKEVTKTDLKPRENQQTSLNAWTDVMRRLETAVASITSTLPPRVLLPHSHRQSTSQDTTIAGRDVITSNFHPTTFPTNHKPSNTSPAFQVFTSIPPPTVVSPTPFQRTPVRPQGSTQEEGTPVRPQGSTQEEGTPVRPQGSTQEEGTPVRPQGSTQEEGTPVRPQGSTQEERTPVRPQGSTQEEGTPVRPQGSTQEERTPVRPQGSTQEEGTPVRPQGSTQEEGTTVHPQGSTQEEGTTVRPQGSTQEERTPVRPQGSTQEEGTPVHPQATSQEEGTPVRPQGSTQEERTPVRPQGSTQEEGTTVHPQGSTQEEGTTVRPQGSTQEERTPVRPQGSTQEEGTTVRPQATTQEEGTTVRPQGSTQEEGTPVRPQVTSQEEGTPVRPQATSQEEGTPVRPQATTQEEGTTVRPQATTQEEGTPVHPQVTSQEEGTPVRPQVSTQEEGTPVRPQATSQEEGTPVRPQATSQEEGTPVRPQVSSQEEGTTVRPQGSTQEEGTTVRPQGSTQEEATTVRPQVTSQEEGTPVRPQVSTQEEGTPVRPQATSQEEGTPVRPQVSTQEEGTPVRPQVTSQEEGSPVRPQVSTQEEGTPVRPQATSQEEGTPVHPQATSQEEGTPVLPQGSTQEEGTLVSTQKKGTPVRPQVTSQEERKPVHPQVSTQEEGTPVHPQVSTQEERTPVHPQATTQEERTLVSTHEEGTPVSTHEEGTPVRPQGSTQEEGTPVRPEVSIKEERTPVRPQMTTQEEGTPVRLQVSTQEEQAPVRPQVTTHEDRTLVSTQGKGTPVHPLVTSQKERTPAHPQVSTQEEGTLVRPQMSTQDEQTLGHTSNQRGKPRITTYRSQTIAVRTGADAQLPCDTEGQPMPFLSWTKVSSGVSIAKNMGWQRLEVHHNGTLIIRNSQETDAGRYLCTVQNQYGTDTMTATLLVSHQPPLRDIHVYEGGKAELECKVAGDPRVSWILPNSVQMTATSAAAPSPPQRVAVDEMGTLLISSAHLMDAGIYRCSVPGGNGVPVRLRVSAVPALIEQEKDQTVVVPEGGAAYIHCATSTASRPIIRWIAPGGMQLPASHPPNGGNFFVFPNGTLHIKRLASKDSGRYICTAGNAAASSSRAVILRVISKPSSAKATITASSPKTTDVTYGSPLLLNCVAAGEPEPRIIWRTPSKKLVDHQFSFDSRIKVFLNGSLSIHSVTDKDRGDYLCVARNKMGDDYIQLRVNVLTKPAKIEQKMQKSSQEVIRGQDLKVDCVASGLPSPEISWALPDGTMVNPVKQKARVGGGRSRRYVVFDNGTLYFNEVGLPEEGDYICYAQNQLGKDEMKVRVRVKGGTTRPQIQDKGPKTVRVLHGKTVALQCKAIGNPVPVVTWMSPKNRLISPDSNKYQVLQDGSLVVQKVQGPDGGNYTCLARSSVGQDDKVTQVEVLATPPVINGLRGDSDTMEVTAVQGERTLVDCATKGAPSPRVMWILPGNVILPAPYYSNHRTVHPNGTLEIRSTQRRDSGQMVCVARNEGGEVRMLVHLEVKETVRGAKIEAPEKESFALRVGNSVTLNCTIDGLELTHLTWILPDGTPLHTGARISKFFHRLDGSLVISNPSVAEAGVYRCMGRNPAGLFESTITLSPGRKPQILNRYISPVSVLDGETLFLHCQTTGEPLRLTWTLPSGVVLNRLQNAGRYSILQNGTIAIRQASVYDRGAYVCRAANEYGSSLLSVSVKIVANQPRITRGPSSVTYAKHGVAVQLNCATAGTPAAEVTWETPDKVRMVVSAQPRLFGNKYLHPQGSLIIQNPTQRDSGVYRCTARNAAGVDSKTTFLNVF